MTDILVKPIELTTTANDLRTHAKKLQAALDAVDAAIKSLGPNSFQGNRADALQAHYNRLREKIYQFKPMIDHFANDLDDAALRFSNADKPQ